MLTREVFDVFKVRFCHIVAIATASLALSGTAFAGFPLPEIDPGTATGGLAILGVGAMLVMERYRARR